MTDQRGEVIRSADNQTVKLIRSLRQRRVREAERAFVVEGKRAVEDALAAGGHPRLIAVREDVDWFPNEFATFVRVIDAKLFDRIAETETPQGVLAVFDSPAVARSRGNALVLVADGIGDPGNLGTLIRSAAAAGATAVAITPGTVDPFNSKAVRAAMGAHFRVPLLRLDEATEPAFTRMIPRRLLADASALVDYDRVDLRGPIALIVGSEAHGPTAIGRALATEHIRIPLANDVESLNAATAGTILLFEAKRQRHLPTSG